MNIWANCDNCKHDDEDAFDCTECLATRPPSKWEPADNYEPPSNADRIRAMSDEELAAFLYRFVGLDDEVHFCENRRECQENVENIRPESCVACLVRWLKQPAEDTP